MRGGGRQPRRGGRGPRQQAPRGGRPCRGPGGVRSLSQGRKGRPLRPGADGPLTTQPVTETTPPVTKTTPPVTETTPPATETTPPVTETTPPATETTQPATGRRPSRRPADHQKEFPGPPPGGLLLSA